MDKDTKTLIIFSSGFLTPLLQLFIPIGGGGISIIFLLSIPFLIGLGIIFSLIYYFLVAKISSVNIRKVIFITMLLILLGLTFLFYPYA